MHERGTAWHGILAFSCILVLSLATGCARDVTPRDRGPTGEDDHSSTAPQDQGSISSHDETLPSSDEVGEGAEGPTSGDADNEGDEGFLGEHGDIEKCEAAGQEFAKFVAGHRSCESHDDCTVIGDCGPNADFTAVRVDAAAQASLLMNARCATAFDGPVYDAVCADGVCGLVEVAGECCGCPPAGVDAGF
jgi:hypothetical protein